MFKQGSKHPRRFWACECCDSLIVTLEQDDATKYQCPQCHIAKCDHGGKYVEITIDEFCEKANIINC